MKPTASRVGRSVITTLILLVSVAVHATADAERLGFLEDFDSDPRAYTAFIRGEGNTYNAMVQFFDVGTRAAGRFCKLDSSQRPYDCLGIVPNDSQRTCRLEPYNASSHTLTSVKELNYKQFSFFNNFDDQQASQFRRTFRGFQLSQSGTAFQGTLPAARPISYLSMEQVGANRRMNARDLHVMTTFYAEFSCNIYFRSAGPKARFEIAREAARFWANPEVVVAERQARDLQIRLARSQDRRRDREERIRIQTERANAAARNPVGPVPVLRSR